MGLCYKECLKNHAANLGGHALDGCGEFMPIPTTANPADTSSLLCAACGCHRNFHRRDHQKFQTFSPYGTESPPSPSPFRHVASSPVIFSYYNTSSSPRHHLEQDPTVAITRSEKSYKKRRRTRFTTEQKIKMRSFAEKAKWRINGCDEKCVRDLCDDVGIERCVFKVWMHNNKYSFRNCKKKKKNRDFLSMNLLSE
ncbi:unnamed protein product [Cochlearia groenlandica]